MSNPHIIGRTDTIKQSVEILTELKIIPKHSKFDITNDMLEKYMQIYGNIKNLGNKKFNKNYARKLAGLELLRLKFSRGATPSECKEGMVYLISNPAWPKHLKIGMTVNISARLATYQTCDPFKSFKVKHYDFCLNRKEAESKLLNSFKIHLEDGEWIKCSDALKIIKVIRNY